MGETRPLRAVTADALHEGRGGVMGGDTTRRTRWYELTLDCGHRVERTCGYVPLPRDRVRRGGTQHRTLSDVLPAPKRARCDECAKETKA